MRYRPEIDGMRALAVVPVIFFHADFPGFSGGYLGVDIFFVISGYLIGSIILGDLAKGQFSFRKFYERRARRILPALFFVSLACLPFAWTWLVPSDFEDFSQSVVAISLFASNFLFWHESGYFDTGEELKPLLHTWSLAVEEQFYIVFPILLLMIWRYTRQALGALLILGFAVSLALAEYGSRHFPVANFYFLPGHGWELLAGAILADVERTYRFPAKAKWGGLFTLAGLICIAISVALFDDNTRHPSLYTLLPVFGTVLIIVFGACEGIARNILTAKVVVWCGLISYSLYLWHQPFFAFANHYALDALSPFAYSLLIVASIVAAVFTWRYVETPFRRRDRISAMAIVPAASTAAAVLIAFGLLGHFQDGLKARYHPSIRPLLDAREADREQLLAVNGRRCFNRPPREACQLGNRNQPPSWALVGDSHAATLGPSFDAALKKIGHSGIELTRTGCAFALGMRRHDRGVSCLNFSETVLERLQDPEIDRVVLMARYVLYFEDERFDNGQGGVERGNSPEYGPPDYDTEEERQNALAKSYRRSVRRLLEAGKQVILVYPVPEVGWNVPVRLMKLAVRDSEETISTSFSRFRSRSSAVFEIFDSLGKRPNLLRVYPHKMLCNRQMENRCLVQDGDEILYSDDNHLSLEGSDRLVELILSKVFDRRRAWPSPTDARTSEAPTPMHGLPAAENQYKSLSILSC